MGQLARLRFNSRASYISIATVLCLSGLWYGLFGLASGAQLGYRSLTLSSNEVSATATYRLNFATVTPGAIGSVSIEFCSNSPFSGDACTAPLGFDASAATLSAQTGNAGFSIDPSSTANKLLITRPAIPTFPGEASYTFDGIKNPSALGSYYARLLTFASSDGSGPSSDYGGLAFAITNSIAITATVPPYLMFCSAITISGLNCANGVGNAIDFGELSKNKASSGTSQLLAATNAKDGYSVTMAGTTMTSGNNEITAMTNADVSRPGLPQFGLNLKTNAAPTVGGEPTGPGTTNPKPEYFLSNFFKFNSGDIIIANAVPDDVREWTASYLVNVPSTQAPGIYVSTITYICLANF
jgi:hypothetical protein